MKCRTLGRTGLSCSAVGLGTWAFGSPVYGAVSEADALATIRAGLDAGINFFDTAPLYGAGQSDGLAEIVLGKGLGADRDRVIISSKFGRNPSSGCVPQFDAARARDSIDESLRRLGTDRIDLLFFHSPFSPDEIHDDVWAALDAARTQGKIRFIGHSISEFQNTQAMAREWAAERRIDVVQVVYSLLNREAAGLIRDLGQAGVGVVARESLANGFLSGRIRRDTVFPPGTMNARYDRAEIEERVAQVDRLGFLVRGDITSMPQAAMQWVLHNPQVSLVLAGSKSPQELLDCVAAVDAAGYTPEELALADQLHQRDFIAA